MRLRRRGMSEDDAAELVACMAIRGVLDEDTKDVYTAERLDDARKKAQDCDSALNRLHRHIVTHHTIAELQAVHSKLEETKRGLDQKFSDKEEEFERRRRDVESELETQARECFQKETKLEETRGAAELLASATEEELARRQAQLKEAQWRRMQKQQRVRELRDRIAQLDRECEAEIREHRRWHDATEEEMTRQVWDMVRTLRGEEGATGGGDRGRVVYRMRFLPKKDEER